MKRLTIFILTAVLCIAAPLQAYAAYSTTITAYTFGGLALPAYNGEFWQTVNNNVTLFSDEEKKSLEAYESYSDLDSLGRCGAAKANIDKSLMPAPGEERGSISSVKPTGWVQNQYDFISGKYLYNRSHLIGWQLTAENANKKNLITGTRGFNVDGMLPFEDQVAKYIKNTDNHVLYRVTPVFRGSNLLADGVLIEAESLEDESINICVFAYNVQPGVAIDYATGANKLASDVDNPGDSGDAEGNLDIVKRISGDTRYDTAIGIADEMKKALDIDKFSTVVVACGSNYPDALAGGYLAAINQAPILTVNSASEKMVLDYLKNNLESNGRVYILGGTGAVSAAFENKVKNQADYNVKRLSGADRYETNLAILRESGADDEELLVCSGRGYADSLSASAAGKPILLTDTSLSKDQIKFIDSMSSEYRFIIGGTGAVSIDVENTLKKISGGNADKVMRISGADRYETSYKVAKAFFGKPENVHNITLAYGMNFPDGLSGGPLAYFCGSPLLLAENTQTKYPAEYIKSAAVENVYVLGGKALIGDSAISTMLK